MKVFLILFLSFFSLSPLSGSLILAAEPVVIERSRDKYLLGHHLEYFVDKTGELEIDDFIRSKNLYPFVQSTAVNLNFGFSKHPHWFRFTLKNPLEQDQKLLLEYAHPHMDSIQIFIVRDSETISILEGGDLFGYNHREVDHNNLVFRLSPPPKSTTEIYIRCQTQGSMQFPLTLWKPVAFAEKTSVESFFFGIYFGIMLAMLFYNFFLFLFLKDKSYLYYNLYLLFLILVQLSITRFDVKYLWPDWPVFANLSFPAFYNLAFFFGGLFSRNFLDTKKRAPILDKIIMGLMGTAVYGFMATLLIGYNAGFVPVLYVLAIFEPLVLLIAGIHCWRKGLVVARYYTIAWFALLISALVFNLRNITLLPSIFITDYSLYFGSALEVIFLSLALGDRINDIKKERFLAQRQAFKVQQRFTSELEIQVRERTFELEKANGKLEELSNVDGLTGLFNRRYFDQVLNSEWRRLQRNERPLSLILADIDYFKQFNDTYGHPAGDRCIQSVADIINASANREADVAARYGGEEFAVILPDIDNRGAEYLAQNIRRQVLNMAIPHSGSEEKDIVTLSFGVATCIPSRKESPNSLVSLCDQALYKSKKKGRDTISVIQ